MISVVTYGRNDNYGYNLHKRTAFGFNCLAEVLTEEDEILFADYNTPDHLPTLPEFIWDTLTPKALKLLKVIRIPHSVHEEIKGNSPLSILENVSRNAAIARSNPANHWMLSTNPDVLLVLAARWRNLNALLANQPDSFYEMPRFDIPESVWGALDRRDPGGEFGALRDWLIGHGAAIAEVMPDPRFQKYLLFDAPGDFQLAPRDYFMQLRGFDESMNRYLHSDSNLAKRMWLLNDRRTDHLIDHLWVLHQDHYLSGEWAHNVGSIKHNDYQGKVLQQWSIEANDEGFGLQRLDLPFFSLAERTGKKKSSFSAIAGTQNGNLALSRQLDWSCQPLYRVCHYQPEVLTLYLREFLSLLPASAELVYLGDHEETWRRTADLWYALAPEALPTQIFDGSPPPTPVAADVLLVDCFYERAANDQARVDALTKKLQEQHNKGRLREDEGADELARFMDMLDAEAMAKRYEEVWKKHLSGVKLLPGSHIILLGCTTYMELFLKFEELFSACVNKLSQNQPLLQRLRAWYRRFQLRAEVLARHSVFIRLLIAIRLLKRRCFRAVLGHNSILGMINLHVAGRHREMLREQLNLRILYVHHRLVIMRVEGEQL